MKYKVYTKTGDKGETSLFGGTRVPKTHPRIETYGTLDELNVFAGAIRDYDIPQPIKEQIIWIQDRLMVISSILATEKTNTKAKLPKLSKDDISQLEKYIDEFESGLPEQTAFIIPGGNIVVSSAHKARVVCRRAERQVLLLNQIIEIGETVICFLNRLSDYFFVLSRKISNDSNTEETYWRNEK
ncbi:MAG: cob(I)yrinic acid a,c-diamide adenosyltransferase [Candidatus Zixiibacteriota bacterium]|nr:MAG: cob(I)yrinic acid a,c-diamide adenosyltransferase [candidate division Zixibacteria bacterium]